MPWRLWEGRTLLEIDNFRAALEWWLTDNRDAPAAAALIAHMGEALQSVQQSELWRWCDSTLAALGPDASDSLIAPMLVQMAIVSSNLGYGREQRAALLSRGVKIARTAGDRRTLARGLGLLSFHLSIQGRNDEAVAMAREAVEHAKSSGDRRVLANVLMREGMSVFSRDNAQGRKLFDEAQALFGACDDPAGSGLALLNRAECEFSAGDAEGASRFAQLALPHARKTKQGAGDLGILLCNAAAYNVALGKFDDARATGRESLTTARETQSWQMVPFSVQHLAAVALHDGHLYIAARLIGWCDAYLKAIDEVRQPTEQIEYDRILSGLQNALTDEEFQSFRAEGAMLTEDAACEEALRV
jgi:tetratricopeptide (TPR) repeat protein